MIKFIDDVIKIDSKGNSLIIEKYDNRAELIYYGKKLRDHTFYKYNPYEMRDKYYGSCCDYTDIPSVISSNGECANKTSLVSVIHDGIFSNRFEFIGAEMVEDFYSPLPTARNKGETVCLTYADALSGVTLKQYYTVFFDSDIIATHTEVINTTDKTVTVNRLSSLQLDFVSNSAEVTTFDGHWCKERSRHKTKLTAGKFENSALCGISSGEHNPFLMLKIRDSYIGLNLIWSGNHKETVEVNTYGGVRVITGMNDFELFYDLAPGERLVAPEAIMVSASSETEMTRELHRFSLNHIISPVFAYKDRPILINNWEGTGMKFTGEKIKAIAKTAADCGIEMFVLDDGWFGKRDDSKSGLGDWFDNAPKTGGLKKLADEIRSYGMKFGLWVEPEMISEDSDLYRAHPEFAQRLPDCEPIRRRSQLCLDLCNPDVVDYLYETLIKLFKEVGVDYVKWDHNRAMSDLYSSKLQNQGRFFYDYYVGQYELLRRITEACPEVLFESCSSGGNRFDLGMEYFMSQNWASDCTNPFYRLQIQEGTLVAYPPSSMGAHVSAARSYPRMSIETRFNVSAVGAFGYEYDITKADEEELRTVTAQVAYYKEHRHLLQYGNYTRIGELVSKDSVGGWMVVSDDKSEAIAVLINTTENMKDYERRPFLLSSLDPDALYKVSMRPQTNLEKAVSFEAYGDSLMELGIDLGMMRMDETDESGYAARFTSRMLYLKKVDI
ncbi:MAG: alpha-galactosidase [Clostridia bacterium]|nr:alpha-galactosidase [Clostridia bacterium]